MAAGEFPKWPEHRRRTLGRVSAHRRLLVVVYTSTDGGTWTAMGAAVTGTGVTSIFDSTAEWIIGARGTYSPNTIGSNLNGTVYEVDVRSGIGGYSVLPRLPEAWPIYSSDSGGIAVVQIVGSPALHVVNSSHPGAGITYFTAGDRLSRMTPDYGQVGVIFSTSHNETKRAGDFPAVLQPHHGDQGTAPARAGSDHHPEPADRPAHRHPDRGARRPQRRDPHVRRTERLQHHRRVPGVPDERLPAVVAHRHGGWRAPRRAGRKQGLGRRGDLRRPPAFVARLQPPSA